MVQKAENFGSQLDLKGSLKFRSVNTFEQYQGKNFVQTMQTATKSTTSRDTDSLNVAKKTTDSVTEKQNVSDGKEKSVKSALEQMSQSGKKELVQKETEELTEEDVMAVLQTAVMEVKQQLMDLFGLTEQQFAAVLDELGMTEEDLTDPKQLTKIAMKLLGTEDQMELLFHPEVTELLTDVQDKFTKLSEDLENAGMDLNRLLTVLKEANEQKTEVLPEQVEVEPKEAAEQTGVAAKNEILADTDTEQEVLQEAPKETVQVTAPEKNSGKQEKNLHGEEQNLSAQVFSKLEEVVEERMPEIDARDVIRQVVEEIKLTVKADTTSFEMQLNPEHLGKINLQVAAKNGVVTAQIATETLEAKEILEAQLSTLKETLEHQGVKVEAVEVSVGARSFDQNLDGQAENQNQEAGQETKRRFRFDVMDAEEGELTSAEQIAREIMMANGNRIDYSA